MFSKRPDPPLVASCCMTSARLFLKRSVLRQIGNVLRIPQNTPGWIFLKAQTHQAALATSHSSHANGALLYDGARSAKSVVASSSYPVLSFVSSGAERVGHGVLTTICLFVLVGYTGNIMPRASSKWCTCFARVSC
jgi:hypothetical protein